MTRGCKVLKWKKYICLQNTHLSCITHISLLLTNTHFPFYKHIFTYKHTCVFSKGTFPFWKANVCLYERQMCLHKENILNWRRFLWKENVCFFVKGKCVFTKGTFPFWNTNVCLCERQICAFVKRTLFTEDVLFMKDKCVLMKDKCLFMKGKCVFMKENVCLWKENLSFCKRNVPFKREIVSFKFFGLWNFVLCFVDPFVNKHVSFQKGHFPFER